MGNNVNKLCGCVNPNKDVTEYPMVTFIFIKRKSFPLPIKTITVYQLKGLRLTFQRTKQKVWKD